LKYLIEKENITIFYFNNYKKFEMYCLNILTELKFKYPNIKRIFCCNNHNIKRSQYFNKANYDEIVLINSIDKNKQTIFDYNMSLINKCNFILFYFDEITFSRTFQYAKNNNFRYFNFRNNN